MSTNDIVSRTYEEAIENGASPIKSFAPLDAEAFASGTFISVHRAKPGDLGWFGPWIRQANGTYVRRACYLDENLNPSNCVFETKSA